MTSAPPDTPYFTSHRHRYAGRYKFRCWGRVDVYYTILFSCEAITFKWHFSDAYFRCPKMCRVHNDCWKAIFNCLSYRGRYNIAIIMLPITFVSIPLCHFFFSHFLSTICLYNNTWRAQGNFKHACPICMFKLDILDIFKFWFLKICKYTWTLYYFRILRIFCVI